MILMEGKKEAEIVESGGVWVLAETHIFNFLFGDSDGGCTHGYPHTCWGWQML